MTLFLEIIELGKKRMKKFKNIMSLNEKLQGCGTRDICRWYQLDWDYQEVWKRTWLGWAPEPVFTFPKTPTAVEEEHEMDTVNAEVDKWEISRKRITLEEVIGAGSFGTVWRAVLSSGTGQPGIQFVAAKCFTLVTDHEPLTSIFNPRKGVSAMTVAPLQRYALFLAGFDYSNELKNTAQHGNADGLSRLPLEEACDEETVEISQMSQIQVMPTRLHNLKPNISRRVEEKQQDQELRLNHSLIRMLAVGQTVVARDYRGGNRWVHGVITTHFGPLSCEVRVASNAFLLRESAIAVNPNMDEPATQLNPVVFLATPQSTYNRVPRSPSCSGSKEAVTQDQDITTSGEEGRKSIMKEIGLGKELGDSPQENIVQFIGCVTTQIHPILIMEYLPCGDLLGFLRKSRGIVDKYYRGEGEVAKLKTYDLVSFANQIATGMVFLATRGIIHRDLAARNVLLDKNCVCKVADFGLYYHNFRYGHGNAKKGCVPVKWTAPEVLFGDIAKLSSKSDVWSYGVVLYEIFTMGGIPYPGWSEARTIEELRKGYRMPKPPHIDNSLYHLMNTCWQEEPMIRPEFVHLRNKLREFIEKELYLGLMDQSKYDGSKYLDVEDVEDVFAADKPLSRNKWSSLKH
ncbi:Tyrosine kinase receptor Cad96Ca [Acropora cervicornis]|uniref:Tyrosine kinase receptor Cad96Ca n=1 Tax=Acropora cervicornis TaxID=6130 RepID=A0AAD9R1G9_ACRCE|nr:Tyrosine kinase receptor Cad96Ca [Acropora cervicornis]